MKKVNREIRWLSLFLIVVFLFPVMSFGEENMSFITVRYGDSGITKATAVSGMDCDFENLTCKTLETAVVGDYLLQVMQISAKEENIFLYPLNSFPQAVFPVKTEKALSLVIGSEFVVDKMPEESLGKTVKTYTEEKGMRVLFVDMKAALSDTSNYTTQNKWEMQGDGSLLVYNWIGPISGSSTQMTTVSCTVYTQAMLDECASSKQRAEVSGSFSVQWDIDPEEVNAPSAFTASTPVLWTSKDGLSSLEITRAILQMYPDFCMLTVDVSATGIADSSEISLEAIIGTATGLKMTDFSWEEQDGVLSGHLYSRNYIVSDYAKLQIKGTMNGEQIWLSLPLE